MVQKSVLVLGAFLLFYPSFVLSFLSTSSLEIKFPLNWKRAIESRVSIIRSNAGSLSGSGDWALLFDCDGVLADTERDGHRPAFNEAFEIKGLDTEWDVELYGKRLQVGGGKERMTAHWNEVGWPASMKEKSDKEKQAIVKELHLLKTDLFMKMIEDGKIPLRRGVLRVVDQAIENDIPLGVCSTSNEKAVSNLVLTLMGKERAKKFQIFAGDCVPKKKPSPDIYNLAAKTMGLDPAKTVVIEDSEIGNKAAKSAGMKCIVTKSSYTQDENFAGADMIVNQLGEENDADFVDFDTIRSIALKEEKVINV